MAILNSCCCWKSIRKACYACAIYSLIYFIFLFIIIWQELQSVDQATYEKDVEHKSVLMPEPMNPGSWMIQFLKVFLGLSIIGIVTSVFLVIGVWKDKKLLLLPWIFDSLLIIIFDIVYVANLAYEKRMSPRPEVAMVLTIDFFSIILNIYALLCVISQFQEYLSGRGRAEDEHPPLGVAMRYSKSVPTLSVETGRRNITVLESKSQVNGISPRQNRLSFRNPSIKVNRVDKSHLGDHEAIKIDPTDPRDVPTHVDELGLNFAVSDCIRMPSSVPSDNDFSIRRGESKKKVQFPSNCKEGKLSHSEPAAETSETSATTECDSSSGRDWTNEKSVEHSPLICLSEEERSAKF